MGDFKRIEMVNWTALLGLEQGVKVRAYDDVLDCSCGNVVRSQPRRAGDFG